MNPSATPSTSGKKLSVVHALQNLEKGADSFSRTQFSLDEREELIGSLCAATIVYKEDGDIIFQLVHKRGRWPQGMAELLGDAVAHWFGSTDRFSASFIPELSSWAMRARGLAHTPPFRREHHVHGFVSFLDNALALL